MSGMSANPSRPPLSRARQRADRVLVEHGLFESRAKAQEAIAAGLVRVEGEVLHKASQMIDADHYIEASAPYPWVSRGGVKLAAGIEAFGVDPRNRLCLDIGASTGGFTHVLLSHGAKKVIAIEVGHGQLHETIAKNPRVDSREGVDARDLRPQDFPILPSLITCDASFISLHLLLPAILALGDDDAFFIGLIKPQFEAGRGHKSIIRDGAIHARVCAEVEEHVAKLGWQKEGIIPSPITGTDGNQEFLIGARRTKA
ncbi:TlyA family RNA methyltransferase [Beijerinckia indica]|uniref:Hemolysin A n=1 Tax=Beijerinckia indica subsp. indica (strain ATCC 9039 / DSM 1715 / NCIMB 8712) TaxID=395963 RepID=B2IDK5_BEII9|nr:TlyA family RNA methyltransferase [Beijerinckia indica]ACB95441.1 hemolysin A [Beijerinckia indica subsp. indica ATCC 9039]